MDPITTVVNFHTKYSSADYEALPALHMYEKPDQKADTPYQYETAAPSVLKDSILGEAFPDDDEQIYEDPGHEKEAIYSWFEEKKVQNIRGSDIKCV